MTSTKDHTKDQLGRCDRCDLLRTGCRFPDFCRLHVAREFDHVFVSRQMLQGEWFAIHLAARTIASAPARLGLIISKRFAPNAVVRNRYKRIARNTFRQFPFFGYDFVLRLKKKSNATNQPLAEAEIVQLFQRLNQRINAHGNAH